PKLAAGCCDAGTVTSFASGVVVAVALTGPEASQLAESHAVISLPHVPWSTQASDGGADSRGLHGHAPARCVPKPGECTRGRPRNKQRRGGKQYAEEKNDVRTPHGYRHKQRQQQHCAQEGCGKAHELVPHEPPPYGVPAGYQNCRQPRAQLEIAGERTHLAPVFPPRSCLTRVEGQRIAHKAHAPAGEYYPHRYEQIIENEAGRER